MGGTPGYVPPETLTSLKWFPSGDSFSMGVTMFQVITKLVPPEHGVFIDGCKTAQEMFRATMEREPPWEMLPKEMPGLQRLLEELLTKDMDKRPRPSKVLRHAWFTESDVADEDMDKSYELTKNTRDF